MSPLKKLLQRRDDLAARLAHQKAQAMLAAKAIELVGKLEKSIPEKIALVESIPVDVGCNFTTEDFHGKGELLLQARQVAALKRLQADLPAIRAHWVEAEKAFV